MVVFGVLEGLALGLPVGLLTPDSLHLLIPAPSWLRETAAWCCVGAFLLLPIWSVMAMRLHRGLLLAGVLTCAIMVLVGLLFAK